MPDPAPRSVLRRWCDRCASGPIGVSRFVRRNWPRLRRSLRSLRDSDASTATTLRLFTRNYWLKARHLSLCCGNPGQPGC